MLTALFTKILIIKSVLAEQFVDPNNPGDGGFTSGSGGQGGFTSGNSGQGGFQSGNGISGLTPTKSLSAILNDIIGFAAGLAIAIASLMIIYAGYQILTSGGNTEQYEAGKKTITYAVIGLIVIFLSATVIAVIRSLFGV